MQFVTIALAALASGLVSAAPAGDASVMPKRSCTTVPPTSPAIPFDFNLAENPAIARTETLTFTIPSNAVGPCSLVVQFPANYPIQVSGGSQQANVFAVDGPAPGSLVGTYNFAQSASAQFATINSFACRPSMSYLVELAATQGGSVDFSETSTAGLFMTFNC
ncbi:hypothetical protein GQ53DRAFT_763651 [Thozetella sp. PMI_491]|nr:hypothetical protein GQ53DRAFT_763651 [Thozetella sp. PMI_491]